MSHLYYCTQAIQSFFILVWLISLLGIGVPVLAQERESTAHAKYTHAEARKFDEYGDIKFDDEKARLDNFAIALQSEPHSHGYFVAYGMCEGEAMPRAGRGKDYLFNARNIDLDRLVIVDGGCMAELKVELWIVPIGATPPAVSTENIVSPCPECRRRVRRRAKRGGGGNASFWRAIPEFPWPPPLASAVATVPRSLIENAGSTTRLADVAARLEGAFYQAGYGEMSWYRVPEGFAIISRLEQLNSDGTPLQGDDRFSAELARPRGLKALVTDLFFAREGHYRVIAFVVTPVPIQQSPQRLSRSRAAGLISSGADRLPKDTGSQLFTENHRCTAIIYEFVQRTADHHAEFVSPGTLDGATHLRRSGILNALERRRQ